jgi:hypothetical protein
MIYGFIAYTIDVKGTIPPHMLQHIYPPEVKVSRREKKENRCVSDPTHRRGLSKRLPANLIIYLIFQV